MKIPRLQQNQTDLYSLLAKYLDTIILITGRDLRSTEFHITIKEESATQYHELHTVCNMYGVLNQNVHGDIYIIFNLGSIKTTTYSFIFFNLTLEIIFKILPPP